MNTALIEFLLLVERVAIEAGTTVYLVGGMVRDALLGQAEISSDVDLLLEGDSTEFALKLQRTIGGELRTYDAFLTKKIEAIEDQPIAEVDIIQARKESYKTAGALPTTAPGTIEEDLHRRDFTINALACNLVHCERLFTGTIQAGQIVTLSGGWEDLQSRTLRVFHDNSFVDDPTRLFRLVRYKYRISAEVENHTLTLAERAIANKCLETISHDRIANECKKVFLEQRAPAIWQDLIANGYLNCEPFNSIDQFLFQKALDSIYNESHRPCWDTIMLVMAACSQGSDPNDIWKFFSISKKVKRVLRDQLRFWKDGEVESLEERFHGLLPIRLPGNDDAI